MECHEIQELILETYERHASSASQRHIEVHVSTCAECSRFARVQKALDDRLNALLLPAPVFSQVSRSVLRQRIRHDAAPTRADVLPEIVHFTSFAIATLIMAAVLPLNPTAVIAVGITLATVSHVLLSVIRDSMDDVLGADA